MLISRRYNVLFVHIPKTAGTSIRSALRTDARRCLRLYGKHASVETFVRWYGLKRFERLRSFCVVRDPLERFVSHYAYLKSDPSAFPEVRAIGSLDAYADAIAGGDMRVIRRAERVMPQHSFVSLSGEIVVDDILHYEAIDQGFRTFCLSAGMSAPQLPRQNRSIWAVDSASKQVRAFVRDYYRRDYELFGYSLP
jgi:hypothetical protein